MAGEELANWEQIENMVRRLQEEPVQVTVEREGESLTLDLPRLQGEAVDIENLVLPGFGLMSQTERIWTNPLEQTWDRMVTIYRTLFALVSPTGDVSVRNLSGPVGIVDILQMSARYGIDTLLWITLFININLAIVNLLPVPILDGGHILFATITKLRGRPLPQRLTEAVQLTFLALILTFFLYVTYHDIARKVDQLAPAGESQTQPEAEPQPSEPAESAE